MQRINYAAAKATWQTITRRNRAGEFVERERLLLRIVVDGKRIGKTKLFPADRVFDTQRKRDLAVSKFIAELMEEQEKAIAEEEKALAEERKQERIIAERQEAERIRSMTPTVMDCVREYIRKAKLGLAGTTTDGIEGATILDYQRTARRLEPSFSDVLITDLKPIDISTWELSRIEEGVSRNAIGKCHRLLNAACGEAVKMGQIDVNPVTAVKAPKREKPRPNSLEQEQMKEVTEHLLNMEPTPVVVAAYLGLHLGLRLGEVCGLRWCDVSFSEDGLYVRQSIGNGPGGTYIKKPKSAAGRRFVPFDSDLTVKMLKSRRAHMLSECKDLPIDIEKSYVIGNPGGRHNLYASPTAISKAWASMASNWGLKGTQGRRVTFHDLRHSSVTAAIEAGGDGAVESIAANHGHSDITMTLNVYGSATSAGKRMAAHAAGEYMRPDSKSKKKPEGDVIDFDATGTDD